MCQFAHFSFSLNFDQEALIVSGPKQIIFFRYLCEIFLLKLLEKIIEMSQSTENPTHKFAKVCSVPCLTCKHTDYTNRCLFVVPSPCCGGRTIASSVRAVYKNKKYLF